jgi:hypothetical protein
MNKCNGLMGLLFGHKFEGRYNEEESEGTMPVSEYFVFSNDIDKVINATKSRKLTYVHDVCKRCGQVVEKK